MDIDSFSVSLHVSDINTSLGFYQKLGFKVIDGGHMNMDLKDTESMKWRICRASA